MCGEEAACFRTFKSGTAAVSQFLGFYIKSHLVLTYKYKQL